MTLGVVHQNAALATFDEHNECGDDNDDGNDNNCGQRVHGTGTDQFQNATQRAGQACCDTGEDDDRDAIAQTTFGDLLTHPHEEHSASDEGNNGFQTETHTRIQHQTRLCFKSNGDTKGLEECQNNGAVAGVLRNLVLSSLTLFLQRLERRTCNGHQLHDDRCRDVRHDAQCKHGKARQGTTGEHVEHAENAVFLTRKQIGQHRRVDSRYGNVRADAIHDERTQQEHQATLEFPVFATLRECVLLHVRSVPV